MEIKRHLRVFELQNDLLFAIAYQMSGSVSVSVSDIEDVQHKRYLKWSGVRLKEIDRSEANLISMTPRLCLDKLRGFLVT